MHLVNKTKIEISKLKDIAVLDTYLILLLTALLFTWHHPIVKTVLFVVTWSGVEVDLMTKTSVYSCHCMSVAIAFWISSKNADLRSTDNSTSWFLYYTLEVLLLWMTFTLRSSLQPPAICDFFTVTKLIIIWVHQVVGLLFCVNLAKAGWVILFICLFIYLSILLLVNCFHQSVLSHNKNLGSVGNFQQCLG